SASAAASRTHSPRGSALRVRTRPSSSRSASRAARRSTWSGSPAPRSTSAGSRGSTTTRCGPASWRCGASARGRPSGSSRGTWRALARGRQATSACARRPSSSTVSTCTSSAAASTRSRTFRPTTSSRGCGWREAALVDADRRACGLRPCGRLRCQPDARTEGLRVNIRRANEQDEAVLHELVDEFNAEIPEPDDVGPETWDEEWDSISRSLAGGAVYLTEDDKGPVGMAYAAPPDRGRSHLTIVHVRPRARRLGVATALVAACVRESKERGAKRMTLDVLETNTVARDVWRRLGFEDVAHVMSAPVDKLEHRLGDAPVGTSRASTHVQTDDRTAVERALA